MKSTVYLKLTKVYKNINYKVTKCTKLCIKLEFYMTNYQLTLTSIYIFKL